MSSTPAKNLTSADQKRSVKGQQKTKLKSSLVSPYIYAWKVSSPETNEEFLKLLKESFTCLDEAQKKYQSQLAQQSYKRQKPERRKELREEFRSAEDESLKNQRSQLVIGLSACTRALENNRLRLFLADKSAPRQLHAHFPALCKIRKCCSGLISGLYDTIGDALGVSKMTCIGLKKISDDDSKSFDQLTVYAEKNFPELVIPWLNSSKRDTDEIIDQMLHLAEHDTETSSDEEMEREKEKKNFDHLYVYKTATKRKNEESDFMKFVPTERKKDSQQYEESNAYISANLGRVKANSARVSKKIKKKKIV